MKAFALALILLTAGSLSAQETKDTKPAPEADPSGGIFDFSDLDVPPAEVPKEDAADKPPVAEADPLAGYPEEVRTVLGKLARFEEAKKAGALQQVTAGRKIAAEILTQRAVTTDAATRAVLLERAKAVESLPPQQTLAAGPTKASPAVQVLLGTWKTAKYGWVGDFISDGKMFRKGREVGQWSLLDEKKGIFLLNYNSGTVALFQFEKPTGSPKGSIVYSWGGPYGIVRLSAAPRIPVAAGANDPVAKLAGDETKLWETLNDLLKSKHDKVAAWLLQLAPKLRGEEARLVVERAAQLEKKKVAESLQPGPNFAGVWQWQGKPLEFKDGGIVSLGSFKAGQWKWGREGQKIVVFTLDAQATGAVARVSDRDPNLLRVYPLKGAETEAKRK